MIGEMGNNGDKNRASVPRKKPLSLSPWKQGGNEKMQAYLFVHFREKTTPDGEQVYFGVSKDGLTGKR